MQLQFWNVEIDFSSTTCSFTLFLFVCLRIDYCKESILWRNQFLLRNQCLPVATKNVFLLTKTSKSKIKAELFTPVAEFSFGRKGVPRICNNITIYSTNSYVSVRTQSTIYKYFIHHILDPPSPTSHSIHNRKLATVFSQSIKIRNQSDSDSD
jgi:hypothetical protein